MKHFQATFWRAFGSAQAMSQQVTATETFVVPPAGPAKKLRVLLSPTELAYLLYVPVQVEYT